MRPDLYCLRGSAAAAPTRTRRAHGIRGGLRTCSLQTLLRDAAPLGSITVSIDAKVYGVRKCVLNMREHFRSLVGSRYVVSKIYV